MKAVIALCLLAVFCAVQVSAYNPLEQLKNQLNRAKDNVDAIMRDVRRTRNLLDMNTRSKLGSLRGTSMSTVNDIVSSARKDVRTSVDAAKAEGKDAENCFITAIENLSSSARTAFQELQKCQNSAEQLLAVQLKSLADAETVGAKYIGELNNVFPSCYSTNMFQMQSCIAIKLGTINRAIRTYENEVTTVKRNAESGANQVYISASSCSMQATSKARSAATDVRIAANKCIKN